MSHITYGVQIVIVEIDEEGNKTTLDSEVSHAVYPTESSQLVIATAVLPNGEVYKIHLQSHLA